MFGTAKTSGQRSVAEGEKIGIDNSEHRMTAAVAVTQWTLKQVQQTVGQQERGQELRI